MPARVRHRRPSGTLRFANWIGYIDTDEDGATSRRSRSSRPRPGSPSTTRTAAIDDNETFFTSDLQAPLEAGQPTEWDLVVVTDWMVGAACRGSGWLETIDTSLTPNFVANLAENYKGRSFDPDTNLAAPWQSGHDRPRLRPEEDRRPGLARGPLLGRVQGQDDLPDEMRDTVGLSAIRLGSDPRTLTQEQFDAALAEVDKAIKAGIVRGRSSATRMSRTWPAAASSSRWPGPATS